MHHYQQGKCKYNLRTLNRIAFLLLDRPSPAWQPCTDQTHVAAPGGLMAGMEAGEDMRGQEAPRQPQPFPRPPRGR